VTWPQNSKTPPARLRRSAGRFGPDGQKTVVERRARDSLVARVDWSAERNAAAPGRHHTLWSTPGICATEKRLRVPGRDGSDSVVVELETGDEACTQPGHASGLRRRGWWVQEILMGGGGGMGCGVGGGEGFAPDGRTAITAPAATGRSGIWAWQRRKEKRTIRASGGRGRGDCHRRARQVVAGRARPTARMWTPRRARETGPAGANALNRELWRKRPFDDVNDGHRDKCGDWPARNGSPTRSALPTHRRKTQRERRNAVPPDSRPNDRGIR